jgi:hypothetical protein
MFVSFTEPASPKGTISGYEVNFSSVHCSNGTNALAYFANRLPKRLYVSKWGQINSTKNQLYQKPDSAKF